MADHSGTVKDDLKRCLIAQKNAKSIAQRITLQRSQIEQLTARLSKLSQRTLQSDLDGFIAELDKLEIELGKRLTCVTQEIVKLYDMTAKLPDRQQTVLRLRYIDGLDWNQIASNMLLSLQCCWNLHTAAICSLEALTKTADLNKVDQTLVNG